MIIVWGEEKQQQRKVKDDSYLSISLLIFRRPREWLWEGEKAVKGIDQDLCLSFGLTLKKIS